MFIMYIEWGNYDVRTRKSNSPRVTSRFSYGVFQFMSKIKPVVNNLMILLRFVLQGKLQTLKAKTFLSIYLLKTYVLKNKHNCFKCLVLGMDVCNLPRRTKRKSIVKLCLPQAVFDS